MNKGLLQGTTYSVPLFTQDGAQINMSGVDKFTPHKSAKKLNSKVQIMDFLEMLSIVAKSSADISMVKAIVKEANQNNEIMLGQLTDFARDNNTSPEMLKKLLKRADDCGFLEKLNTGHYLMNPYVLLSKGLTFAGADAQIEVQARWSKLTTILTESDTIALTKLSKFLNLPVCLPATEFTIAVANYFVSKGKITIKQKASILKFA